MTFPWTEIRQSDWWLPSYNERHKYKILGPPTNDRWNDIEKGNTINDLCGKSNCSKVVLMTLHSYRLTCDLLLVAATSFILTITLKRSWSCRCRYTAVISANTVRNGKHLDQDTTIRKQRTKLPSKYYGTSNVREPNIITDSTMMTDFTLRRL